MQQKEATHLHIAVCQSGDVRRWHDELVDVYRQAFRAPPYAKGENVVRQFRSTLLRHAQRDAFRCIAARDADAGALVGFGYGYASRQGQWWHDEVLRQLDAATAEAWFADAFEIVELAVRPQMQGRGIGGRLHDVLLDGVAQRTAVLSTLDADTRGFRLYRSRGWSVLRSGFYFSGVSDPYLIMGKRLPSRASGG